MKPIPCLKGYTYTIIQRMFLFFGVLVLVVVPEKKKGRQSVSKGFFMEITIFSSPGKNYTKCKKRYRDSFICPIYFESMLSITRVFEISIYKFKVLKFFTLSQNN